MILGCNYWASHAGTEMWKDWREEAVIRDLDTLRENGVAYLRVFPNWRDFQPVEALYGSGPAFREYRLTGGRAPDNPYYLDEEMLRRFERFCDLCQERGLKLIVGLLTGWMSGMLFAPPALIGKDLCQDPEALYLEQLYLTGLVRRLREKQAIRAWDHGNECGCIANPQSWMAGEAWLHMLSNAIYAQDRSRPLISGWHFLDVQGTWQIRGQGQACDKMATHPYPFWGTHTRNDTTNYIRSTLYSAAQSRLYSDLGGKPCLVEEVGTMGPGVCSEERAADFLNISFFSCLANGVEGILWWCASDQHRLMTPPYTWVMCENELGMMNAEGQPKPVLKKMGELARLQEKWDLVLPPAQVDAICILTPGQDNWGVGYMSYILSKQAHLNIGFADGSRSLPDSKCYLLPCVCGVEGMPKEVYYELLDRVRKGATLYISHDGGILSRFEEITGNRVLDTEFFRHQGEILLNGKTIPYRANMRLQLEPITAEPVQNPMITKNRYGKGLVYYVNFPAESMLIDSHRGFDAPVYEVYREVFREVLAGHKVKLYNENVALTLHPEDGRLFAVAVNHSEKPQKLELETDCPLVKVHYGDPDCCKPMDAVILEFRL